MRPRARDAAVGGVRETVGVESGSTVARSAHDESPVNEQRTISSVSIPVIDVFAGPGGLNEGFSSLRGVDGQPRFRTAASFEMDSWACETLRLRATFRAMRELHGGTPGAYVDLLQGRRSLSDYFGDPDVEVHAKEAAEEVRQVELGEKTRHVSDAIIRERLEAAGGDDWVLIGGPPCQAYSLAGRSRRAGDPSFKDDHKHVLYREYLNIIAEV